MGRLVTPVREYDPREDPAVLLDAVVQLRSQLAYMVSEVNKHRILWPEGTQQLVDSSMALVESTAALASPKPIGTQPFPPARQPRPWYSWKIGRLAWSRYQGLNTIDDVWHYAFAGFWIREKAAPAPMVAQKQF